MILINNNVFETKEDLQDFFHFMKKLAFTDKQKEAYTQFVSFLEQCHRIDVKLQNDVNNLIGRGFISYIKIPFDETDDFNSVETILVRKNQKIPIRKRDNLLYDNLVQKHFKKFKGFLDSLE